MKRFTQFAAAVAIALSAVACSDTDGGVTTKVKAKFAADDVVKAHDINVTTREGVVTLTGEVDSAAAREQAARLARDTEGVIDVVNDLDVEVAATSGRGDVDVDVDGGVRVDGDVDVDVDNDIERGARKTGDAIRDGAEATADAARRTGSAVRDAVTDNDRDSDNDGK
jgi:hyperosmotically inducible protein